jgi:hypothetical protein
MEYDEEAQSILFTSQSERHRWTFWSKRLNRLKAVVGASAKQA